MCEQVSYKERKGRKKRLLWPCVNQGHECETELYVCVWTSSVKTTSCVWASQTGHVRIWWTHIHILAGVPTHPVAPNTPWPYLYSQQKHTYTHRAKFMHNQRYTETQQVAWHMHTCTNTQIPPPTEFNKQETSSYDLLRLMIWLKSTTGGGKNLFHCSEQAKIQHALISQISWIYKWTRVILMD